MREARARSFCESFVPSFFVVPWIAAPRAAAGVAVVATVIAAASATLGCSSSAKGDQADAGDASASDVDAAGPGYVPPPPYDAGTGAAPDADTTGGCLDNGSPAGDWKGCASAADCTVSIHQTDCCGTTVAVGVANGAREHFLLCEHIWESKIGDCACDPKPSKTETGQIVPDGGTVVAQCVAASGGAGSCTATLGK